MNATELEALVESYPAMAIRCKKLESKLMSLDGLNPLQEESILQRIEQTEKKMELVNHIEFDSNVLTDRESIILSQRIDGLDYKEIGDFFSLHRERIRSILKEVYKKLESLDIAA